MEVIYRTIDNKEFTDEACATFHERIILEGVRMVNWHGKECEDTREAVVVVLHGASAADIFMTLCDKQGDTRVRGIEHAAEGVFVWNTTSNKYEYLDVAKYKAICAAMDVYKELQTRNVKGDNNNVSTDR